LAEICWRGRAGSFGEVLRIQCYNLARASRYYTCAGFAEWGRRQTLASKTPHAQTPQNTHTHDTKTAARPILQSPECVFVGHAPPRKSRQPGRRRFAAPGGCCAPAGVSRLSPAPEGGRVPGRRRRQGAGYRCTSWSSPGMGRAVLRYEVHAAHTTHTYNTHTHHAYLEQRTDGPLLEEH
jgi:hypothetical protein